MSRAALATGNRPLDAAERASFRVARLVAYSTCPYYAAALFSLTPVAAPGLQTFAVDPFWRLYMDPALLVGDHAWTPATAGAVLLHEVGHLLRAHADRAAALPQPLHHSAWNIAGDAEINDDLLAAAVPLPEGAVTPQSLGCLPNDVAEHYYAHLLASCPTSPPQPSPAGGGVGQGSGSDGAGNPGAATPPDQTDGGGSARDREDAEAAEGGADTGEHAGSGPAQPQPGTQPAPPPSGGGGFSLADLLDDDGPGCGSGAGTAPVPGELPPAQEVDGHAGIDATTGGLIRRRVAEAVREEAAKGRGTVPGGMQRWADEVLAPPTVPWNRVLRGVMRRALADAAGRVQFSYAKPSRRSGGGLIFPSMRGPRLKVAIVVDTSGSMSPADLSAALSEIRGVLKSAGVAGDRVTVITCDAESGAAQRISRVENIALTGGGGTDMRVGIDAAETSRPRPEVCITITDGLTPWPDTPTRSRLVCVIVGDDRAAADTPQWALTVTVPSGVGQ